jgi:hypothetical protein
MADMEVDEAPAPQTAAARQQPAETRQAAGGGLELPWVGTSQLQFVLVPESSCGSSLSDQDLKPQHEQTSQLEKYRPTNIKDVVGNVEAIARLQVIAEEGNMPNLILAVSLSTLLICTFTLALQRTGVV